MFDSVEKVRQSLVEQSYICDAKIATVVFLANRLEKPVLVEGPAGVGKTELAKVVAAATGRQMIRLQCYEGLDEAKALYEWEYSKQLLYTQILKEKFTAVMSGATTIREAAERVGREDSVFFSDNFIVGDIRRSDFCCSAQSFNLPQNILQFIARSGNQDNVGTFS